MQKTSPKLAILALIWLLPDISGHAQTREVFVTATFEDKRQLLIEDLQRQEIEILENDKPRQIEFMARDEVPTVYGILFDRSILPEKEENYRGGNIPPQPGGGTAKSLAYEMIDKYLGRQTLWVGSYERELRVALDYSTDGFRAKDAIQRLTGRASDEPFLYSALISSVMKMKDRHEKRRVLIVFMSVVDSDTAGKLKPLKNLLTASNVEVFLVSFAPVAAFGRVSPMPVINQASVRELAQSTAGEAFFAADFREHPDDVSRRILNVLRTFYTFGFESESPSDKPGRLTVRCLRPGAKVRSHSTIPSL
jgi:VWFA-related protein